MATIFYFNRTATAPRDQPPHGQSEACEIILFPGVRYERWVDAPAPLPAAAAPMKKSRAKKRELELAD